MAPLASGAATVSIHVRDPAQRFNSLDPSPFWDRDPDRDAATFIEEEFTEKPTAASWHLSVHLRDGQAVVSDLQQAITNYCARLAASAREVRDGLHGVSVDEVTALVGAGVCHELLDGRASLITRMSFLRSRSSGM
jgi:hypothetical protein